MLGQHLAGSLELAAGMIRRGHMLGNHGWSHARDGVLDSAALQQEFEACDALIRQAYALAGQPAPAVLPLRLPYGEQTDDSRLAVLARMGRQHIGWTLMLDDWQRPAPAPLALFECMLRHQSECAAPVFCLHDGSRHGEARPNTVAAISLWLRWEAAQQAIPVGQKADAGLQRP